MLSQSAKHAFIITPSDTLLLPHITDWVWVGALGNLTVTMMSGEQVTFTAVPAGTRLDIRVGQVWAAGTTASNLLGLWDV